MKPSSIWLRGLMATALVTLSATPAIAFSGVLNPYVADNDPAGFGRLDPSPPSGITVEEIIKKFGERESAFNRARQNYIFRQSVKVQTISEENNRPDGEYQQV